MKVRATQMGYYDHQRRRVGDEFEMAESNMRFDQGKLVRPRWVEKVEEAEVSPAPSAPVEVEEPSKKRSSKSKKGVDEEVI